MTSKESIKVLQHCGSEIYCQHYIKTRNCYGCNRREALNMAIEALTDHSGEVTDWIPCSERLPDNKTYVLTTIQVSGRQPHARSGFYHDGFFHNDNGDTWKATDREVRAWMPLPDPYREDGE